MKKWSATILVTVALTLVAWMFFYIKTPETPLNFKETSLVMAVCFGIVHMARWIWTRIHKTGIEK